jgi:hypothetical protein
MLTQDELRRAFTLVRNSLLRRPRSDSHFVWTSRAKLGLTTPSRWASQRSRWQPNSLRVGDQISKTLLQLTALPPLVPFEDEIRPRTPPSRYIIERNGRGCEHTVHSKVTPSTPAPQKRSSQSTRELLNEVEDREQVLSGEVLTLQTRLSYAQRDLWQLQNIVSEHKNCGNGRAQHKSNVCSSISRIIRYGWTVIRMYDTIWSFP